MYFSSEKSEHNSMTPLVFKLQKGEKQRQFPGGGSEKGTAALGYRNGKGRVKE